MNLGAFGGGAVQGFDTAQSWKDRSAKRERDSFMFQSEKEAKDALDRANSAWGRAISTMSPLGEAGQGGGGPPAQPPMPGQASQPMSPPPQQGQMSIGPHSFANQPELSQGVSGPPGMQQGPPPQFGQGVQPPPGAQTIPQQPMHPPMAPPQQQAGPPPNPLGAQPYKGPSSGMPLPPQPGPPSPAGPPPPQQGGMAPSQQGGMQPGSMDLNTVVRHILKANPDLDPKNPKDAMIIARAAGNALPYMKQDDAAMYHQMVTELRAQKQDTAEDQGNKRIDIAQQRADQGWQRVQQASDRMLASAKARADNLELNYKRLDEAKKKGDTSAQRLLMDQIKNDRAARDQTVNSISNLLRSASPSQLKDPAIAAEMEALHQQMKDIQKEPSITEAPSPDKKSTRSEDAVPAKAKASVTPPKAGTEENGYTFKGGDPADPKNWVPSAVNAVPLASSRPGVQ